MDLHDPPADAQQALAVYAESLAVGKRVAVFGDASLGIAGRLADLGARTVHVWDPDFDRARLEASRAPRGVVVRALLDDGVDVRDGAFDLALVADLGLFGDVDALLERVRRLVGHAGAALVSAGGAGGPRTFDYYELFDRVAREFEDVRMIAQLPFYGVALAELGDENGSPAVTVDTQLADADRTPQNFVALASQSGVRLDPYAIFELPPPAREMHRDESDEEEREQVRVDAVDRKALSRALVEAGARIDVLEAQADELRAHLAAALQVARAAEPLEEALRDSASRLVEFEQALGARGRQLAELSYEAETLRAAAQSGRNAASLVEQLGLRAERAEAALSVVQSELRGVSEAHANEHGRYEEALRERAQAIRRLEAELAQRERMVRDLIAALEEAGAQPAAASTAGGAPAAPISAAEDAPERDALVAENARLRAKLNDLALELARVVAEGEAAAWSIAELERKLAVRKAPATGAEAPVPGPPPPSPPPDSAIERRLGEALDELNVLRRALAQEHEARVRAESGDELARAREEIQRQAVLLEQLRAPPI